MTGGGLGRVYSERVVLFDRDAGVRGLLVQKP